MGFKSTAHNISALFSLIIFFLLQIQIAEASVIHRAIHQNETGGRERISINAGWRFWRSPSNPDNLAYDKRPDINGTDIQLLKEWILPIANDFIKDPAKHHRRPAGNAPGSDVSYVQNSFNDSAWESLSLPHDWAIKGPFYVGANPVVGGGMGRLPSFGVGWYRRKINMTTEDAGKTIYLDIDGAQSYAMIWLNGDLVGGWPYGYNSFRLDLTPHLRPGNDNQLAIRLDNPKESSRWYPGGGLYRNVWLTKVNPTHVAQFGTYVTSREVSAQSAVVDLVVQIENRSNSSRNVEVVTTVHVFDSVTGKAGEQVSEFSRDVVTVPAGQKRSTNGSVTLTSPRLWGPPPTQKPNLYVAITSVYANGSKAAIDTYETRFGIRSFSYDGEKGLLVNGEHVPIRGVNQHHDLGALGGAFNLRAATRQLEMLQELGSNAIRMSHNPPAPELLDLTDQMGFLVMDEIFDCWDSKKTNSDFHLIFPEWDEPDLRAFIRRDRNHASIYAWSFGNEVGEQSTGEAGAAIGRRLNDMMTEEDPTRPSTASMNVAKPNQPFPQSLDILSLNYQGEGIRDTPEYSFTSGSRTPPIYAEFHKKFPNKMLHSSETAAALSTRGTYIFPVTTLYSAPVNDSSGGNSTSMYVSAYELHSADFGSSADKVFASLDRSPFVAGEFVWSGWDYMGEPTPYYSARSSYFGIIDLAGFKKDRFYLYQSRWRPDLKMAHILPHWTWPDRVGLVTPVHIFSAADEAELFVNGESQGRLKKESFKYRFRWDQVVYQPGELHVVTYKHGSEWANATVRTTTTATKLRLTADRSTIQGDGYDLSFITCEVLDSRGDVVPNANHAISFSISGVGEIVATDNGDPTDMTAFPSKDRKAFNGLALAIVKAKTGATGKIIITARGKGLEDGTVSVEVR